MLLPQILVVRICPYSTSLHAGVPGSCQGAGALNLGFLTRTLTAGDNKTGAAHVLYDLSLSNRGVLLSAARKRRPANPFDFQVRRHYVITLHRL